MYSIDTMTSLNLGEQGEHLANELRIDMSPWLEGTEGLKCYIYVLRHAETSAYIAATTMEDDNVLLWPVSSWDTAITGAGLASFVATDGTRIIRSKRIRTEVGTIIPGTEEDEIPEPMEAWRDELIAQITVIRNAAEAAQAGAETAQSNAETAQAAAEDARDEALGAQGAAETARDNARTAQNAAEAARDRAVSAETAANGARDSAQAAQAAAEAAQSAAAESATAAMTSENNAKSSELIASVNQMSALNYSKSAKQSADKAESQASMAETAKGLAFDKADEATASASAAAQSETNAAASASAASTSESNAAASAQTAAQSASQAAGSATQAGNSATAAAGSASQASQSATAAGQSARNAEDAAQDAQDVLDSIPADYSQMSADVEDLKDAVLDNAPAIIAEASGALASFTDGADDRPMKSLVAHIEPVQKGSGDPSPDNIRPITGWTGMKVSRTGKNLANQLACLNYSSGKVSWDETMQAVKFSDYVANSSKTVICKIGKPGVIRVSYDVRHDGNQVGDREVILVNYTDGTTKKVTRNDSAIGEWRHVSFSTDSSKIVDTVSYGYYYSSAGFPGYIKNVQVELGTVETDYEPYSGDVYNITFPSEAGTVYGGTLDVISGLLTVDRAIIASYNGEALTSEWISDRDVYVSGATPATGAQVVYKLADPITYQLTPQEVKTLLGQNYVFADTGDVDVTYQADTKLYVDNKFTELQALVLENIGG